MEYGFRCQVLPQACLSSTDEVSCRREVDTDVELREVVGWHPQVAHTAAIEVSVLTVEAPVGGIQHVGDAQLPELSKRLFAVALGRGGREAMRSGKEACLVPCLRAGLNPLGSRRSQRNFCGVHGSQPSPRSFLVGELGSTGM